MAVYHTNPETGDSAACSASVKPCPFGDASAHYTSIEAAREAFELKSSAEKSKALKAWKRKPKPTLKPTSTNQTDSSQLASHGVVSGHGVIQDYGHGSLTLGHGGY